MAGHEHTFQRLVQQAVEACGHNVECIEAFIEARKSGMTAEEQEALRRDIELVLGFREPSSPYKTN